MIQKPIISENFTLEDIRKIRDYNDEIASTMTLKEYRDYLYRETEPYMHEFKTIRPVRTASSEYIESSAP
jgi:hypothetical protein